MKTFIEWVLAQFFPPRLPKIKLEPSTKIDWLEDGITRPAQPRKYRDAIDRHFQELAAA